MRRFALLLPAVLIGVLSLTFLLGRPGTPRLQASTHIVGSIYAQMEPATIVTPDPSKPEERYLQYNVTINNIDSWTSVYNIVIQTQAPVAFASVVTDPSCQISGNVATCTVSAPAGSTRSYYFGFLLPESCPSPATVTATVSMSGGAGSLSQNIDSLCSGSSVPETCYIVDGHLGTPDVSGWYIGGSGTWQNGSTSWRMVSNADRTYWQIIGGSSVPFTNFTTNPTRGTWVPASYATGTISVSVCPDTSSSSQAADGADLALTMSAPDTEPTGSEWPVTVTLTNNGPATVTSFTYKVYPSEPGFLTLVSQPPPGCVANATWAGEYDCTDSGTHTPGWTRSYSFTYRAPQAPAQYLHVLGGTIMQSSTTDSMPSNDSASLSMTVTGAGSTCGNGTCDAGERTYIRYVTSLQQPDASGFSQDASYGLAVSAIGDFNRDGIPDMAVATYNHIWINLLDRNGSIIGRKVVGGTFGQARGTSLAFAGYQNSDNIPDLVVGDYLATAGGQPNSGSIWIEFLNTDANVISVSQIYPGAKGFTPSGTVRGFGSAVANVGDMDKNGHDDLAVTDGAGRVWILYLENDTTQGGVRVKQFAEVENFNSMPVRYGWSIASLDGSSYGTSRALAMGALYDSTGGADIGAVHFDTIGIAGNVVKRSLFNAHSDHFPPEIATPASSSVKFGSAVANVGDWNGDGIDDLAVSAMDYQSNKGAVWILYLDGVGLAGEMKTVVVKGYEKLAFDGNQYGLGDQLTGHIGTSLAAINDIDGDGKKELLVGAPGDPNCTHSSGAAWLFFSKRSGTCQSDCTFCGDCEKQASEQCERDNQCAANNACDASQCTCYALPASSSSSSSAAVSSSSSSSAPPPSSSSSVASSSSSSSIHINSSSSVSSSSKSSSSVRSSSSSSSFSPVNCPSGYSCTEQWGSNQCLHGIPECNPGTQRVQMGGTCTLHVGCSGNCWTCVDIASSSASSSSSSIHVNSSSSQGSSSVPVVSSSSSSSIPIVSSSSSSSIPIVWSSSSSSFDDYSSSSRPFVPVFSSSRSSYYYDPFAHISSSAARAVIGLSCTAGKICNAVTVGNGCLPIQRECPPGSESVCSGMCGTVACPGQCCSCRAVARASSSAAIAFTPPSSSSRRSSLPSVSSSLSSSSRPFSIALTDFCGDGVATGNEPCDQGPQNSDTIPNRCRTNCTLPRCGDGVRDSGEECDDGNVIAGDGCDYLCRTELSLIPVPSVLGTEQASAPAHAAPTPVASSSSSAPVTQLVTLPSSVQPVVYQATLQQSGSLGKSGPETVIVMVSGAAAGFAWLRRKRSSKQ
jgi:cysteine-rich repeat protein